MNQDYLPDREPQPESSGHSSRMWILVAAAALVLVALFRLLPGFSFHGSSAWEREFDEPVRQAEIGSVSADVILLSAADGRCRVEYSGSRSCSCEAQVKNGVLTVTEKKTGRLTFHLGIFRGDWPRITVYLPEDCDALTLGTVSGDLHIPEGFYTGEAAISTVSGDVDARSLECAALTLGSVSGDMKLADATVSGLAELNTISGDISLTRPRADSLTAVTVSGDLHGARIDADALDIETTSGDVSLSLVRPMVYAIETTSGDTFVPASAASGGVCRVHTTSGDIHIAAD